VVKFFDIVAVMKCFLNPQSDVFEDNTSEAKTVPLKTKVLWGQSFRGPYMWNRG